MSSPMEWVAYTLTAVSISTLVAALVYVWTRDPDKDHYCAVCDKVTLWHPKNGCTVCRSLDQGL